MHLTSLKRIILPWPQKPWKYSGNNFPTKINNSNRPTDQPHLSIYTTRPVQPNSTARCLCSTAVRPQLGNQHVRSLPAAVNDWWSRCVVRTTKPGTPEIASLNHKRLWSQPRAIQPSNLSRIRQQTDETSLNALNPASKRFEFCISWWTRAKFARSPPTKFLFLRRVGKCCAPHRVRIRPVKTNPAES